MKALTLAQQQYVETVAELARTRGRARTADLAKQLGVRPPSVTQAVARLARLGLVERRSWHDIALTDRGRGVARRLDTRHHALRRFLTSVLGMGTATADANACRIEHCVGAPLTDHLAKFVEFYEHDMPAACKRRWQRRRRTADRGQS